MKQAFLDSSCSILKQYGHKSSKEMVKLKYGLEGLYSFITKFLVVFVLNILLNTWVEFLFLQIFYTIIRAVAFGIHAKSNKECWILTIIVYVSLPLLIKYIDFNYIIFICMAIFSSIVIAIYAPADTEKRPLIHKEKRKQDKILAMLISVIYLVFIILFNNLYTKCMGYALILECLMINPLIYSLTNQKFNNFKYYKGWIV